MRRILAHHEPPKIHNRVRTRFNVIRKLRSRGLVARARASAVCNVVVLGPHVVWTCFLAFPPPPERNVHYTDIHILVTTFNTQTQSHARKFTIIFVVLHTAEKKSTTRDDNEVDDGSGCVMRSAHCVKFETPHIHNTVT